MRCSCSTWAQVSALALFADPATGLRGLRADQRIRKVRVFDPVAGGEALLVLEVGD